MHTDPDYLVGMNENFATRGTPDTGQTEKSPPSVHPPPVTAKMLNGLVGLAVAAAASLGIFWNLADEPHFADESAMIAQSYYYTLLKSGRWNHADWLHYAAYDHPPLPKYLFGLFLDLARLPVPTSIDWWMAWSGFHRVPGGWEPSPAGGDFSPPGDPRVLYWARVPAALFAVGGAIALYSLGLQIHSRLAGALAAVLLILDPLYRTHARRAMSDSFTECLVIASVATALWACRAIWKRQYDWCTWSVILIVQPTLCGLAALAKLNGGIAAALVIALFLGTWLLTGAAGDHPANAGPPAHSPLSLVPPIAAMAAGIGSFLVFVCLNPLMTAQPVLPAGAPAPTRALANMSVFARAKFLLQFRRDWSRDALSNQAFKKDWLRTFRERARMTVWEGFGRFSPLGPRDIKTREPRPEPERFTEYHRFASLVWLPLVSWGILYSLYDGWWAIRSGHLPVAWGLILYMAAGLAIVIFMIPLNWDRYYLPLQAPAILLATVGVVAALQGFARRISSFRIEI